MDLQELQKHWDTFGKKDPMWAIITRPGTENGKWDVASFFKTGMQEIRRVNRYLQARGYDLEGRHALDFGCGIGRLTQALAPHFERVSGVDISTSMVEQARKLNPHGDRLAFHLNEVNDLTLFASNTFDFIYSNITLQHMQPVYAHAYIREFIRVLEPKGLLLFQIPAELNGIGDPGVRNSMATRMRYTIGKWLKPLTSSLLRLRWRVARKPVMEMYGTPRPQVEALIHDAGGTLLDVTPNQNAGVQWESYYYLVTKEG